MRRIFEQVNPDEDSRQRLKMIRGEIDEPIRSAAPGRTTQQELSQQEVAQAAQAAQDVGADEPSREAAGSAAPPAPQAAPEDAGHADEDDDADADDEGQNQAPTF